MLECTLDSMEHGVDLACYCSVALHTVHPVKQPDASTADVQSTGGNMAYAPATCDHAHITHAHTCMRPVKAMRMGMNSRLPLRFCALPTAFTHVCTSWHHRAHHRRQHGQCHDHHQQRQVVDQTVYLWQALCWISMQVALLAAGTR